MSAEIQKVTASEIADSLAKMIAEGIYKPGMRIKEDAVCKEFEVSRTPVREAFRVLQNRGYLVYAPQRGFQVIDFTMEDLQHVFKIRGVLETLASEEAAANIDEEGIKRLIDINDRLLNVEEYMMMPQLDTEFHQIIASYTGDQFLMEYLESITNRTIMLRYILPTKKERVPHTHGEHACIIHALQNHDAELAALYTKAHFHASLLSLENKMENYLAENGKKRKQKK